jgi:O-antigen ligase
MSSVFASAMILIMALVVFLGLLPLGAVNPELALPAFTLAALLAVLWAAKLFWGRDASWNRSPMHWPAALFIAYAFIRYLSSPLEHAARVELFQVGLCGFAYFFCANQLHTPRARGILLIALMALAVFESSYGIWQAVNKSDAVLQWVRPESYRGRASGTLICPNHLAGLLEMTLGLVVARAAIVRRESLSLERAVVLKVLTIYVGLMIVAGIFLTFSRAGWVATVVGLFALLLMGESRLRFGWPRIAVVLVLLGGIAVMFWKVNPIQDYLSKTVKIDERSQAITLKDPTLGGRTVMWKGTVNMIRDNPLWGTGPGSWQWIYQFYKDPALPSRPDYTHNDFLNLASDYGLVGFLIMAAFFVGFYRHAWSLSKPLHPPEQRAFAIGAMVSVTSLLVHSWFDSNLHIPGNAVLLATIMGGTAAMEDSSRRFPRQPLNRLPRYALGAAILLVAAFGMWSLVPTALATRYVDLGNSLKRNLNNELALEYYDYAAYLDPRNPEPHALAGNVYRNMANWRLGSEKQEERRQFAAQAVRVYEDSLHLNRHQALVWLDKAKMHEVLGENDLALSSYEQAIKVYPANPHAYFLLGRFFRDHGEPKRALEAFKKSRELFYSGEAWINESELEDQRE